MPSRRRYLRLVGCAGATATAGCLSGGGPPPGTVECDGESRPPVETSRLDSVDGAWPNTHFDAANTGATQDAMGPVDCPQTQWQSDDHDALDPPPVVADGRVYVSNIWALYAFDAVSGETVWRRNPTDDVGPPTVSDGAVYAAGAEGLVAVRGDGEMDRLGSQGGMSFQAPTVVDGTVYVSTDGGEVRAVGVDGEQQWSRQVSDDTDDAATGPPAVVDGTLYVGTESETTFALDTETGEQQWTQEVGEQVDTAVTVGEQYVYVATRRNLHALRRSDGTIAWTLRDEPGAVVGSPALSSGQLYVLAGPSPSAQSLLVVDANDGTVERRTDIGLPEAGPAVADGIVYVGSNGQLAAIDADDGELLWSMDPGIDIHSSPAIVDGVVVLTATTAGAFAVA